MGTPRSCNVKNMGASGLYHYFGIESSLKRMMSSGSITGDTISLLINVDGLPIAKSSSKQFWPILASVVESCDPEPFVIALFVGDKKPENLDDYLTDFISELSTLLEEHVTEGGKECVVRVHAFICDAPARAFLKCIKGHGGYFSCEKCTQEGTFSESCRKVILPEVSSPLRTDESFRKQDQEGHHHRQSPLVELQIGMVSQFPLDYMHLVCLGVMRRLLLHYWVRGRPHRSKLPPRAQTSISTMLMKLQRHTPREMARKPRSLHELERWKATELRNFLLYFGPAVLKDHMEKRYYQHFLKLSIAVSILSSPRLCHEEIDSAEKLLEEFVSDAGDLYGEGIYVYNIHSLLHLTADVRRFGHLDSFSAFRFENFLGQLKRDLKSPNRPLQQIVKRLEERSHADPIENRDLHPRIPPKQQALLQKPHNAGPAPPGFKGEQYHKLVLQGMVLEVNLPDSCFLMEDGNVVVATNVVSRDGEIKICGQFFKRLTNFYAGIVDTTGLCTFRASQVSSANALWTVEQVKSKCCWLPCGGEFLVKPLLHTG
ncbi:uncharacterized protein LOC121834650 [Ixodes scapularis]|uniref:uncharacterized protein LOC121834650 n=1 Tax=Ixodes scapularis TaxID=6945 RepID=UPI001C389EE3|nr:uncharacterized protein LOC121834650 [Ixodes scapularis]